MKKRTSEVTLSAMIMEETKIRSENTWIANWFMRCHVTNSLEGMYNVQEVTESVNDKSPQCLRHVLHIARPVDDQLDEHSERLHFQ